MKKLIFSASLLIFFTLTLVCYLYYSNNLSGKPTQLVKIPFNQSSLEDKGNLLLEIDPILLSPENNPYRLYLSVGFTPKVGRASLTNSSYSYKLTLSDKNQQVFLESIKKESKRNRLGGNPELLIDTMNLGVASIPIKDFYDLKMVLDKENTDIKFIQIDIRENAHLADPNGIWMLSMLIGISLINLLVVAQKLFKYS